MSVCSKSISVALLVGVGVVLAGPIATPSGLPVHGTAMESRGLPVPRSPFGVKANEVTQGIPVHHRSMGPLKIDLESKCPQECMVPDVHHVMCDIRKLLDWNSINPQERSTFDAKCPSSFDLDIWCDSVPKCYGALAPSGGQYGSPLASGSGYKGPLSGGASGSGSYGPANPLSYGPGESGPTVHGGESGPYGSGPSLGMNSGNPISYGPGTNGAGPLTYGPGNVHGLALTGSGNPAGSNDPNNKVDATFGNPSPSNDGTKSAFAPLSPSGSSQQNGPNEIDANLGKPSGKSGLANILPNGNAPSDSGDATAHMNGPKSAFDPSLSSSGSTRPSDSTTIDIPIGSDSTSANGMSADEGAGAKGLKKLNGPKQNGQVSTGAGPQAGGDASLASVVEPIVDPLFNGLKASSNDMTLEGSLGGDAPAGKGAQGGVKGLKANSGKGDAQDAQGLPLLGGDDDCDCQ